jgi:hypothetical protein
LAFQLQRLGRVLLSGQDLTGFISTYPLFSLCTRTLFYGSFLLLDLPLVLL